MIFAKLLRVRDKFTAKRKNLSMDEEKPFLEHLEDLRKMLMKVTITLLCALVVSMFWYNEFMDIVKWPAREAGLDIVEDPNKPEKFDAARWEAVKATARNLQLLTDPQRTAYGAQLTEVDPDLKVEAQALLIYKASWDFAQTLNEKGEIKEPSPEQLKRRDAFITQASVGDELLLKKVQELVTRHTRPDIDAAKPAIELVWRKPAESFFTAMKLALYAGLLMSFPLLFYFLLEFVLPGLTPKEKKLLWPALAIGFGLFLTGMLFAFFWVVPRTLAFFHNFSGEIEGTKDLWTFADYTSFVTVFSLVFGASFELPVVVLILVKLGLMTTEFMRRTRSWAIIIIVVVAAVITPTGDPGTLAALAVPMIVMYEACIWIAVWMERKAKAKEILEEKEAAERHARYMLGLPALEDGGDRGEGGSGIAPIDPSGPPSPTLHPDIQPYRNPHEDAYHDHDYHNDSYHHQHDADADHDAWLKEQEEIYRKEHAHLFAEAEAQESKEAAEKTETSEEAKTEVEPSAEPPTDPEKPTEEPEKSGEPPKTT